MQHDNYPPHITEEGTRQLNAIHDKIDQVLATYTTALMGQRIISQDPDAVGACMSCKLKRSTLQDHFNELTDLEVLLGA